MQNPIRKFRQTSYYFQRNQPFCLKNRNVYLVMSTKGCAGFFYILFTSWVIKSVRNECLETRSFLNFANNIGKYERCAKFQEKRLNCRVVGALFSKYQFSVKMPGFSKTIELYLNFCIGFWITYLVLLNYN